MSLSTGIVADTSVNCEDAVEKGHAAASQMTGKKFTDITLHLNCKVKTIGAMSKTIKVRRKGTEVNQGVLYSTESHVF